MLYRFANSSYDRPSARRTAFDRDTRCMPASCSSSSGCASGSESAAALISSVRMAATVLRSPTTAASRTTASSCSLTFRPASVKGQTRASGSPCGSSACPQTALMTRSIVSQIRAISECSRYEYSSRASRWGVLCMRPGPSLMADGPPLDRTSSAQATACAANFETARDDRLCDARKMEEAIILRLGRQDRKVISITGTGAPYDRRRT